MNKILTTLALSAIALGANAQQIDLAKMDREIAESQMAAAYQAAQGMSRAEAGETVTYENGVTYIILDADLRLAAVAYFDWSTHTELSEVEVPEYIYVEGEEEGYKVVAIGPYAFQWATFLTSIKLPDSILAIGQGAFMYNQLLTEFNIPSSCTVIEPYAFYLCAKLKEVNLPEGLEVISECAFANCVELETVTLPETVTTIDENAFYKCCALTEFNIGKNVTSITYNPWGDCWSLEKLNVDSENPVYADIDGVLFNKDKTVLLAYTDGHGETYAVPEGTKEIGIYAFYYSEFLAECTLPESLEVIGPGAFFYSNEMTTINIPANVKEIGLAAFYKATAMKNFTVDPANQYYKSVQGVIYNITGSVLVNYPCGRTGEYRVIDGTYAVADAAFGGAEVERVYLPQSCELIGPLAFGQSKIVSVDMPGVTDIYEQAFYFCYYYTTAVIPASIKSIDSEAYKDCLRINKVISYAAQPPKCGTRVFDESLKGMPMSVLVGSGNLYRRSVGFSMFNITEDYYYAKATYDASMGKVDINTHGDFVYLETWDYVNATITPNEGFAIEKVLVNNVDMTAEVNNGMLTVAPANVNVNMVVEFKDNSGIADVEAAEEGEAQYYDLRGVRVAQPESGIFIKVVNTPEGNRCSKVVF